MQVKRYYLLDLLRGLASLMVVLWHYQHFFYVEPGIISSEFLRSDQPLYELLNIFYEYGRHAVELFFVLSGFIFYTLYYKKIGDRNITSREFFILRFSRLYPLHFLTLLFVTLMQFVSVEFNGQFEVYPNNDIKHFVLNLFFASSWGLQDGYSYNGPIWSVSVEVLLYTIFFVTAFYRFGNMLFIVMLIATGLTIVSTTNLDNIGWGIFCFFCGGVISKLHLTSNFSKLLTMSNRNKVLGIFVLTITATLVWLYPPVRLSILMLYGAIFPIIVFLLAEIQRFNLNLGSSLHLIGDITYSTYLLHFPLQLIIIVISKYHDITIQYNSIEFFSFYFVILILISTYSYRYFELPMQRYIRKCYL